MKMKYCAIFTNSNKKIVIPFNIVTKKMNQNQKEQKNPKN